MPSRIQITSRTTVSPVTGHVSPGRKTGIAPANLQQHLESAANAVVKGQAQFHTPPEWAAALALALPQYRPVLVDLTCGNGQLLAGTAAPSTKYLIGADIERPSTLDPRLSTHFVQADLTRFYSLLRIAGFEADCFVLNFPWDLHQYRDRLAGLAQSDCPAVEMAFGAHDGRTSKDTIDSTIAGFCIALDRCSPYGEGCIIANEATLQRLIFALKAPHAALATHIWAHLVIPGNICSPNSENRGPKAEFRTGIIYFARSHIQGCQQHHTLSPNSDLLSSASELCSRLGKARLSLRRGSVIRQYEGGHTPDTVELWDACREEWNFTHSDVRTPNSFNIYLDVDGTIKTNLSLFDQTSGRVKKEQYQRLFALNGRHPMQLILQKAERKELERAVFGATWRVAPAVVDAVQNALAEYNAVRSPLYPLSQIQRLGYLDDNDDILCCKNLEIPKAENRNRDGSISAVPLWNKSLAVSSIPQGEPISTVPPWNKSLSVSSDAPDTIPRGECFRAGTRYAIRTETIRVKRSGTKMNLTGERDEVEWEGSELALFIRDGEGIERLFMEERLRGKDVTLSIQDQGAPSPIEYNLQDLIQHFEIPEVPDVALVHPAAYQKNLEALELIESIVNN